MATYPSTVPGVTDGSPVAAGNTNQAAVALAQRTEWLREQLLLLTAGTALQLKGQPVEAGLVDGTPVYFDNTTLTYKAAQAAIDNNDFVTADPSAAVEGIVYNVSGTVADVSLGGLIELTTVQWALVFDTGIFGVGEIFLSTTRGRISLDPGSLGIYLGNLRADGTLIFRPVNTGPFLQHIHLQRFMTGNPAGTVIDPPPATPQTIATPNPALPGWLPATNVYFPGYVIGVQIPAGAQFGYNIQHASETLLRQVFPLIPPTNAQFSQSELVLGSSKVVANQYGIWWMDNSYGNAPWPVDYTANLPAPAPVITLWTSRLIASVSLEQNLIDAILSILANGEIEDLAVSRAIPNAGDDSFTIVGPNGDNINGWYGPVTFTNTGVKRVIPSAGIGVLGTLGTPTARRGDLTLRSIATRPAQFLHNKFTAPQTSDTVLVTTNGVPSGVDMTLYAHGLGADPSDFIDFVLTSGVEFPAGEEVQFTLDLALFVDLPVAAPVARTVRLAYYAFNNNSPMSSTSLIRTEDVTIIEGTPGAVQRVSMPAYADVKLGATKGWILRVINGGATPLTAGTLRVASISANLVAP
jgi:hypothetical protein